MSIFLTAEWRKLIMAQYEVSPETLAPWLPPGVELDLYEGRCFVSLVGFLFDRVRVKGVAVPFHTRFEEINLRFYVARTMTDGTRRRGVVFIREFVPRAAITLVATRLYEEPYATLPTFSRISTSAESLSVKYSWKHSGRWQSLAVEAAPKRGPSPPAASRSSSPSTIGVSRNAAMGAPRSIRSSTRAGARIRSLPAGSRPTSGLCMERRSRG